MMISIRRDVSLFLGIGLDSHMVPGNPPPLPPIRRVVFTRILLYTLFFPLSFPHLHFLSKNTFVVRKIHFTSTEIVTYHPCSFFSKPSRSTLPSRDYGDVSSTVRYSTALALYPPRSVVIGSSLSVSPL